MFPLKFPLRILSKSRVKSDWVLDPFSGRGTTNYAARLLGLPSIGIDNSPVAHALTSAKLANATPSSILECAEEILDSILAEQIPTGEFWSFAYAPDVLKSICCIRESLLKDCSSDSRKALRGIMMGALHGPMGKKTQSYFSNQCLRSYAPKPDYAVRFWKLRNLGIPPNVDLLSIIQKRALRYFSHQTPSTGKALRADSRYIPISSLLVDDKIRWTITSPPYYGMRTYIPDQWLRNWFVGGPPEVSYSVEGQLSHDAPDHFAEQLRAVWENVANASTDDARLIVRFGGIADRSADALSILKESFKGSSWRLKTVHPAGSADSGKRQAVSFSIPRRTSLPEYDAWARLA